MPLSGRVYLQSLTLVSRERCPPAHVMGRHDVQHLGGLDPHLVISILQQSFQALQAACEAEKPLNLYQSQKSNNLEVNR